MSIRTRYALILGLATALLVALTATQATARTSRAHRRETCVQNTVRHGKAKHGKHARQAACKKSTRKHPAKTSPAADPKAASSPSATSVPPPLSSPTPTVGLTPPPPPTIVPTPPSGPEQTSLVIGIGPGSESVPAGYTPEPAQGTITVTETSSGQTVATETVGRNQLAYIPVSPGTYTVTAEAPPGAVTPSAETCTEDYTSTTASWSHGSYVGPGPVAATEDKQTYVYVAC